MKNYWIIGDIHGEAGLLDRLLEHILPRNPEALIFVGDYIDRGPASREVVDRILELELPVHCLMGNHEMMLLNALEDLGYGQSPVELWYYNGGEATLRSFGANSFFTLQSDLDTAYLEFFRNLQLNHVIPLNSQSAVMATHAGISPAIPLADQFSIRNYRDLTRYMLENHIDPGDSFIWVREGFFRSDPAGWKGYMVVHGHTPVMKLRRMLWGRKRQQFVFVDNDLCIRKDPLTGRIVSIDIDSGSAVSGRLTGLGFFPDESAETGETGDRTAIRSLTVSKEEIFPRDLGNIGE
jgi:serine/threonine protein phosphatase 1